VASPPMSQSHRGAHSKPLALRPELPCALPSLYVTGCTTVLWRCTE
jgi:hypothetical protein